MQSTLPKHDIVLLGAGHTNAHVLRMWRMAPLGRARLTCVSNFSVATYSGMLPGTLAGLYPPERMQIDLVRLCAAVGARFIQGEVTGLDVDSRRLLMADRPPIPFDVLSIGIGSIPRAFEVDAGDETLLAIKPMQTFLARLEARLAVLAERGADRPLRVAVVGAGAGGVEITFCLPARLRAFLPGAPLELHLIDRAPEILTGASPGAIGRARSELERRGVRLQLGRSVRRLREGRLELDDGSQVEVDLVLLATGAVAPPLLTKLGLPTDEAGFLLTRPTLQTTADAPIFVVGDSGTCPEQPTPKAGVYAVRQGPVLWENLRRRLREEPLAPFIPQRGFLSLMATGDRRAILTYKGLSFHAGWCWRLKNYIDGRFMNKYQDYEPMEMEGAPLDGSAAAAMRCAGCGGKVGGSILSNVLRRLDIPTSEHVLLGLEAPDDAAVIRPPGGRSIVATADFFTAFMDDPYLVGRVAALNAASDVFALGAKPIAALALASLPQGPERQQEQLLHDLLAGGLHEFNRMGAVLVGGHTIESTSIMIGYTLLADAGERPPRTKAAMRAGEHLVLTKPLGAGVLLAAHMQASCRAAWHDALVASMTTSNQQAAEVAQELDIEALTDVTGFGLAGHLLEMLRASDLAAELRLADLPLLPGAAELLDDGLESTLAPANRTVESEIDSHIDARRTARYNVLFDPQTSGGLLLSVPEAKLETLLDRLAREGETAPSVIGRTRPPEPDQPRLRIV